jgi:hypothetical protein
MSGIIRFTKNMDSLNQVGLLSVEAYDLILRKIDRSRVNKTNYKTRVGQRQRQLRLAHLSRLDAIDSWNFDELLAQGRRFPYGETDQQMPASVVKFARRVTFI